MAAAAATAAADVGGSAIANPTAIVIDHVSRLIARLKECDSTFVSARISSLDDASLRQLANALARVLDQV